MKIDIIEQDLYIVLFLDIEEIYECHGGQPLFFVKLYYFMYYEAVFDSFSIGIVWFLSLLIRRS
jgi:hypothetical protein